MGSPIRTITNAPEKNYIINGCFDYWQRGTSFTINTFGFGPDRWRIVKDVGTPTTTIIRQSHITGQFNVPPYNNPYYVNISRTSSYSGTEEAFEQLIEDVRTLNGKTVTLSVWAKASSNISVPINIDQWFGTGGTPSSSVTINVGTMNVTPSWARYDFTVDIPSVAGKTIGTTVSGSLTVRFMLQSLTSYSLDLGAVQLVEGSTPPPTFYRAGGNRWTELRLCQRYYERVSKDDFVQGFHAIGAAWWSAPTTHIRASWIFATQKRAVGTPSWSGQLWYHIPNIAANWANILNIDRVGLTHARIEIDTGLTTSYERSACEIEDITAGGWFAIDAEL